MAIRTLAKKSLTTATKTSILPVSVGNTASISNAVVTNISSNAIDISVYISDGGDNDTLATVVSLAGGIGKSRIVPELIGGLNSQYSIKMQGSTANGYNCIIYGELTNS